MKQHAKQRGRRSFGEVTAPYLCCKTCRNRRIKCDGARPSCDNCVSHGRQCLGYSSWDVSFKASDARSDSQDDLSLTRVNTTTNFNSVHAGPSIPLYNNHSIEDAARQGFDYFRFRNRFTYASRGYPTLWTLTSISTGMQGSSAVFYAMAALGTAEQALAPTFHTTLVRPIEDSLRQRALRLYSKAIGFLQDPMRKALHDGPLHEVVLSCALFLVFEVTSGNIFHALGHGRAGKNILEERLKRKHSLGTPPHSVTSSQSGESSASSPYQTTSEHSSPSPDLLPTMIHHEQSFVSLEEARSHLEALGRLGHELRDQLLQAAKDRLWTLPADTSQPSRFCYQHTISRYIAIDGSLQSRLHECLKGFASWKRRFTAMYHTRHPGQRDLLFVQARFFYASFSIAMCRATSEQLADNFADQFTRTLDSLEVIIWHRPAQNLMAADESTSRPVADDFMTTLDLIRGKTVSPDTYRSRATEVWNPILPSEANEVRVTGVFEIGVLHALFAIACKCRTSSLRHRALQLLEEANRSETFISSQTLATYARTIIRLEEEQAAQILNTPLGQRLSADEVSDDARFLDVVASANPGTEEYTLSCTRRSSMLEDKVELLEYECRGQDYRLFSSIFVNVV